MTRTEACCRCVWWDGDSGEDHEARCHRYPPVLVDADTRDGARGREWDTPIMARFDWCGEFTARPTPTTED